MTRSALVVLIVALAACNLRQAGNEEIALSPSDGITPLAATLAPGGSLTILGPGHVSLELEGAGLYDQVGELTPRGGTFLVLYATIHNQSTRSQCIYARDVRLYLNGREYVPQDGAMSAIRDSLRPRRDFIGSFSGQCVSANSSEPTFIAFTVPTLVNSAALAFAGRTEPIPANWLAGLMIETSTPTPSLTRTPTASRIPRVTPAATITLSPAPTTPVSSVYYTAANARARSCPETTCRALVVIPEGTALSILQTVEGETVEASNVWMETVYNGRAVYIHSSLLTTTPPLAGEPTARP
jgi:hypothetical protein